MTWGQFVDGLRRARDGAPPPPDDRIMATIAELGYVTGSHADAAGICLTQKGREYLARIERDTADMHASLIKAAALFDRMLAGDVPSQGDVWHTEYLWGRDNVRALLPERMRRRYHAIQPFVTAEGRTGVLLVWQDVSIMAGPTEVQ